MNSQKNSKVLFNQAVQSLNAIDKLDLPPREKLKMFFELQPQIDRLINQESVKHYNGKHPKHHLWNIHYQFILDHVSANESVFDAGTGASSSYVQALATKCHYILCVDNKPERVEYSKQHNQFDNVSFQVLDITREVPSQYFDTVIFSHILEHLHDPVSVLKLYKPIARKVIVRLPRYDDHWMYLVKKDLDLFYFKDRDHKREYTLTDAVHLLESCDYKIEIAQNDVDIKILALT